MLGLLKGCGLRKQELAGLDYSDFCNRRINISRIMDLEWTGLGAGSEVNKIVERTKSASGIRSIPVPDDVLPNLIEFIGDRNGFLFTNANGGPMIAAGLARRWERIRTYLECRSRWRRYPGAK